MRPEPLTAGCARGYNVATAGSSLKTKLIAIDDSGGIRIPAALIEQAGLGDEVELTPAGNQLVITAALRPPREGWAASAAACAQAGDDLLDGWDFPNAFDNEEWTWDED